MDAGPPVWHLNLPEIQSDVDDDDYCDDGRVDQAHRGGEARVRRPVQGDRLHRQRPGRVRDELHAGGRGGEAVVEGE